MNRPAAVTMLLAVAGLARLEAQVDPSGAWHTWTTPHFRIHARAELARHVSRLAAEAERAYVLLATELTPPRGRIDVALLDNVDLSNGFATFFPSNRITLYLPPPRDESLSAYDEWVRLVTVHELTHIFHLDRADGLWHVLRSIFGRHPALFPNAYQPSWVTEGLATYYETRFTGAGRITSAFHEQLLAAAAGGSRWPGPRDAMSEFRVWPAGFGPYAWGSRFFADQAVRFGDSVVPGYIDRTSRQLWPIAMSRPLRRAGGDGIDAGWARLRERWAPASLPDGRVMRRGLRTAPQPRLAADGKHLALLEVDGRSPARVVVASLDDGSEIAIRRVNGPLDMAWIGGALYLAQLDFRSPVDIVGDAYRWVPQGDFERVTWGARVDHPFALPAGGVGVVRLSSGVRRLGVLSARDAVRDMPSPPADNWGRLTLSPDERWLAGARHHDGRWDIVMWPVDDASRFVAVTDDAALDADPSWSPDGTRLLFASEREGLPQVFAYVIAERRTVRLTSDPVGAREPVAAPDGRLLYSTLRADGFALVVQEPSTGVPVADARSVADSVEPAVPDASTFGRYDPWPALVPRYWTPLVRHERGTGTFIGALTSGSDPIGRFSYAAVAQGAPATARWEMSTAVRYARWRAVALDALAEQTWQAGGLGITAGGDTIPLGLRERAANLGISWNARRWRRAVGVRIGGEVEQVVFVDDRPGPHPTLLRGSFAGGVVSLSGAYTRRQALSISAEDGVSATILYRRRWELQGPGWSDEVRTAVNGYLALPLPGFARWVLAIRVAAGRTGGPTPATYAIGGVSSGRIELVPGITLGGSRRTFPLRGYPANARRFTRVVSSVAELRVPMALVGRGIWKLPLGLDRVSLVGFAEMAGGWQEDDPVRLSDFRSVGGEAVVDLLLGFNLAARVRLGAAVPLATGLDAARGDVRGYLAIGSVF